MATNGYHESFFRVWTPFGLQGWRYIEGEACNSLKVMVARDGIEPPTPAFSVLTFPENRLKHKHYERLESTVDSSWTPLIMPDKQA